MEQKLSDTLVKAIDRSNPFMQNLQLASRFNKLIDEGGGSANLEDNKEIEITKNGTVEITPTEGKDGMKKVTANVNVPSANLEDNKEIEITKNGTVEITPTEGKDGMKKVTANVNVPSGATDLIFNVKCTSLSNDYLIAVTFPRSNKVTDIVIDGGFSEHYSYNENGYIIIEATSEAGMKVSVVYDGGTYSYTYTGRDYEQHDLIKE